MPNCVFCKSDTLDVGSVSNHRGLAAFICPICKRYYITERLAEELSTVQMVDSRLVNCISENINTNSMDQVFSVWAHQSQRQDSLSLPPRITIKHFEIYANQRPHHSEKSLNILIFLSEKIQNTHAFEFYTFTPSDMYQLKIVNFNEFEVWLSSLCEEGLIKQNPNTIGMKRRMPFSVENYITQGKFSLSAKGWKAVEESIDRGGKFAFIAQDFNLENRVEVNQAISETCVEAVGFEASPVDQNNNERDYIPDKIFDSINKSSVVIADLTNNNLGVYFEAGYAKGLGKKLVLIVANDATHTEPIHFDIKQFEQIRYSNINDLKEKLKFKLKVLFPDING